MLLQSHANEIHLLPALPAKWPSGEINGSRARGGVEVDISWTGGKFQSATLRGKAGGTFHPRLQRATQIRIVTIHPDEPMQITR
ncbi:MAG: glycoside hydrolase family 95-like protein [Bryobacteraceae bacterium]